MPTTADRQPPRAPRGSVTRERIAVAALELLDAEGIEAVSMRRVAEALGVGTMTLYGHVRGKDDLLDAAVDAATAGAVLDLSGDWRDRITQLATAARAMLDAHPAIVQIRLRNPVLRPDSLRFAEAGMTILEGAGLPRADAARTFRLLFTYVFGYAGFSPSRGLDASRRQADAAIAGLPAEHFPRLHAARAEMVEATGGEDTFAAGLRLILDGIGVRIANVHRAPS